MAKSKGFNETVYKQAYNKSHYTNCSLRLKPDIMQKIEYYIDSKGYSKNSFFIKSALYIMENDIDLSEYSPKSDH